MGRSTVCRLLEIEETRSRRGLRNSPFAEAQRSTLSSRACARRRGPRSPHVPRCACGRACRRASLPVLLPARGGGLLAELRALLGRERRPCVTCRTSCHRALLATEAAGGNGGQVLLRHEPRLAGGRLFLQGRSGTPVSALAALQRAGVELTAVTASRKRSRSMGEAPGWLASLCRHFVNAGASLSWTATSQRSPSRTRSGARRSASTRRAGRRSATRDSTSDAVVACASYAST
jgi:hypothetical protein